MNKVLLIIFISLVSLSPTFAQVDLGKTTIGSGVKIGVEPVIVGPQGIQGIPGVAGKNGTINSSLFYNKTASDARFLQVESDPIFSNNRSSIDTAIQLRLLKTDQRFNETARLLSRVPNVNWENITNKFITAISSPWLYMTGTNLNFNQTHLSNNFYNKTEINMLVPSTITLFFHSNVSNANVSWKVMDKNYVSVTNTESYASLTNGQIVVTRYYNKSDIQTINSGLLYFYNNVKKTAGTKDLQLYGKLYVRHSNGLTSLIVQTSLSGILTLNTQTSLFATGQVGTPMTLNSTDKLLWTLISNVTGAGTAPTLQIILGGTNGGKIQLPSVISSLIETDPIFTANRTSIWDAIVLRATTTWVIAQGYLTSIPAHTHTYPNITGNQNMSNKRNITNVNVGSISNLKTTTISGIPGTNLNIAAHFLTGTLNLNSNSISNVFKIFGLSSVGAPFGLRIYGSAANRTNLTIDSTSKIDPNMKGNIFIAPNGGKVGIGIGETAPSATLDVNGSTRIRKNLNMSNVGNITNVNRIGIGTTSPVAKLTIFEGVANLNTYIDDGSIMFTRSIDAVANAGLSYSGSTLTVANAGGGAITRFTGNDGSINLEVMRINSNGNVGIGTTTPSAKLDVNGSTRIRKNLNMSNVGNITNVNKLKANNFTGAYYSADSTKGLTGNCTSGMTLTVKNGLITGCV